jgi:hypothetical protein
MIQVGLNESVPTKQVSFPPSMDSKHVPRLASLWSGLHAVNDFRGPLSWMKTHNLLESFCRLR